MAKVYILNNIPKDIEDIINYYCNDTYIILEDGTLLEYSYHLNSDILLYMIREKPQSILLSYYHNEEHSFYKRFKNRTYKDYDNRYKISDAKSISIFDKIKKCYITWNDLLITESLFNNKDLIEYFRKNRNKNFQLITLYNNELLVRIEEPTFSRYINRKYIIINNFNKKFFTLKDRLVYH